MDQNMNPDLSVFCKEKKNKKKLEVKRMVETSNGFTGTFIFTIHKSKQIKYLFKSTFILFLLRFHIHSIVKHEESR